ncbi:hypothetical protein GGX14DRAFT_537556 [Mycena pura]|uniref:C2H2-type domain-containing protein n=1 Tax=Mycena pura TaxID=153505 RepID=A0AAD6UZ49_9AGAR|nr:hypothetical protein GGX14DRAFT_537556 [Mycena pura]
MNSVQCEYCRTWCSTLQGLKSHLTQTQNKLCRQKRLERWTADSEDFSDGDSAGVDSRKGSVRNLDAVPASEDVSMDPSYSGLDSEEETYSIDPPHRSTESNPDLQQAAEISDASASANVKKRRRATVEEEEDEDERWYQPFPEDRNAGGASHDQTCKTQFEKLREEQKKAGLEPWQLFDSADEWELAHWLMTSGLSNASIDKYLKLKKVREGIEPSFHNSRAFLQRIDALPEGPKWTCYPFELEGDELDASGKQKKEVVELWCRDPVECVRELVGNPAFREKQHYAPYRIFKQFEDGKCSNREVNEMWTADWWWEIQELLPNGATLVPVILASDKTQLTRFSGDQQAWPVYLTIGNIDKMLQTLKQAGEDGIDMDCADGFVRKMYLIVAAYIADYPEQCLVCCCGESSCPGCTCEPNCRGDAHTPHATWRSRTQTLQILEAQANREHPPEFAEQNLRAINPFWADLPHCDIFRSMTPDLLHELHNGVFDHLVKWSTSAMMGGEAEVDQRYRSMTPHPALRHFKKGISLTTQWTGTERKNMEKVYLGVLANATDRRVQLAAAGVLDFIHYAHFETHCDESLALVNAAWLAFHDNKDIFVDLEIREHFNISKLHKLKHYVDSIRSRGTADGFNTEGTERLHIDLAKLGYKATNKKAYTRQMTVWLRRQESVHKFSSYLQWAIPGYLAPSVSGDADPEEDEDSGIDLHTPDQHEDSDASDDEDEQPSPPPFIIAKKAAFPSVTVANIVSEFHAPVFIDNLARFLRSKSIVPLLVPAENSTFPVYKKVFLHLPRIPEAISSNTRDAVRAIKGEPQRFTPKGAQPAKAGQFDTVIVRVHSRLEGNGPTDGLSVARVRVIFKIPSDFGGYPDPVAYVDWFKPLQPPVEALRMHQVSLSSHGHRQRSSIIPINEIVRSCHLIPVFGKKANPGWTSDTVLDVCPKFFLNPYLRHHDFYLFRMCTGQVSFVLEQ